MCYVGVMQGVGLIYVFGLAGGATLAFTGSLGQDLLPIDA